MNAYDGIPTRWNRKILEPLAPLDRIPFTMTTEKLDFITIRGFRSIADVSTLELRQLNVLIGANGSGKSNFLAAFSMLREILEGRLKDWVMQKGGANRVLHFGSKTTPGMTFHLSFSDSINAYEITLGVNSEDQLYPTQEAVYYWDREKHPRPFRDALASRAGGFEAGISDRALGLIGNYVRQHLSSWVTYHFHDTSPLAPLRKNAPIHDNAALRTDGSNLPAFLYLLQQQQPASYTAIRQAIQRVAPFFDDFVLEPAKLAPDTIRLQWRHKGTNDFFDVASLSDGTLRFIALATLLLQPQSLLPRIILIDEPELGLHPSAIVLLGSLVRIASRYAQVILSTQSSQLLDQFNPEDVLVAERAGQATTIRRLDGSRLGKWLEDYSLGQLWEKNELGGRP